jgi:hypothetical protein
MSAKRGYEGWGDKRYVRRGNDGRFHESDDVGRSLSSDRRQHSKVKRAARLSEDSLRLCGFA